MRLFPIRRVCCLWLAAIGLAAPGCRGPVTAERPSASTAEDGVYRIVPRDSGATEASAAGEGRLIELETVPMPEEEPELVLLAGEPLLRFRDLPSCEYEQDSREGCTRIFFRNTEGFRAFTRDHVGTRVANVIGGRVISCHKIRAPIETDEVAVSFCTPGGGDHVLRHLRTVVRARER
jgi:hypothetical protein